MVAGETNLVKQLREEVLDLRKQLSAQQAEANRAKELQARSQAKLEEIGRLAQTSVEP